MSRPLESAVERKFVRGLKRRRLVSIKLALRWDAGWTDRLVLIPGGTVIWIELKRPGGAPTKLQEKKIAWLRSIGHDAHCFDDADEALALVDRRLTAASR